MPNLNLTKIDGLRADKKRRQLVAYNYKTKLPKSNRAVRQKAFKGKDNN